MLFTEQVVTTLLQDYKDFDHTVFLDNFYSAPDLFLKLQTEFRIRACETVRINRRSMPHCLQPSNLRLRKRDDPVFARSGYVVACPWHDTKRVHLLSTVHTNLTIDKQIRNRSSPTGYRMVNKPVIAEIYNRCVSGVDIMDQKLWSYMYFHKSSKRYFTLFHRIVEVALTNIYIVYSSANDDRTRLKPIQFRRKVIDGLLNGYQPPCTRVGRSSTTQPPLQLTARHFISRNDSTSKPDCVVCFDRAAKKRKQTSFICKDCGDVPLCVTPCFEKYHTLLHY